MKTILIVDDEAVVLHLLALSLRGSHHVLEAMDAAEALRIARWFEGDIHLAIVDHGLRDRRGVELAREMMLSRPAMSVLLISGSTRDEVLAESQSVAGRLAFLQKPFQPTELRAKVEAIFGGAQPSSAGM